MRRVRRSAAQCAQATGSAAHAGDTVLGPGFQQLAGIGVYQKQGAKARGGGGILLLVVLSASDLRGLTRTATATARGMTPV